MSQKNTFPSYKKFELSCLHVLSFISLVALILFISTTNAYSAQVTLAWNPNTEPDLGGYKIHSGPSSGNYDNVINVGNQTSYTFPNLVEGQTYYLAATAYNTANNESGYSAEVVYTVPTGGGPTDTISPSMPGSLTATAVSTSQLNLSWNASSDNIGVTGYRIYRDSTQIATTSNTTYQDTGLSSSTTYSYTVSAYDAAENESGQSSASSATTNTNQPPVLNTITNITVNEGATVALNPAATDPDGDTLTYTYSGWMTSSSYTTNYTDAGSHIVTVTVSDSILVDTQDVNITVVNTNQLPVLDPITDITVYEGDTVTLNPTATDADGETLTFSYSDWMTSSSYTTTSNDAGIHTVTVTVSDGTSTDSQEVTITVMAEGSSVVMLSPQDTYINTNSSVNANSQKLNTYTWPDNTSANAILMKYDFSSIPVGAIIQDATLYLSLVASDSTSDSTYTVPVHKIINKNPDISVATGYTYDGTNSWTGTLAQGDFSAAAYDTRDIDKTLGYKSWNITSMAQEWINNPSTNLGLLLNSDSTKLRDRYRYFASMEDPNVNIRPYLNITLIGSSTNQAPVLDPITDITVNEGDTITLSPTATDPDGDALTYIYSGWMTSSSYTTNYTDSGTHTVTVTVSDGTLTDSQDVPVTVGGINRPPVLDPISDITVSEGVTITLSPTATDPDGDALAYTYSGWMTSNSYTTNYTDAGSHTVSITVSDGRLVDTQDVMITIIDVDTIQPSTPANLQATAISTSQINLSWNTSSDNIGVTGYRIYRDGIQVADVSNTAYQDTGLSSSTTYSYTVSAYDAAGNESSQSTPVSIAANISPEIPTGLKIVGA